MTLPYTARLICLCFAAFFAVHTAFATAICAAAPKAMRVSESMNPRIGARLVLTLRLLPATLAAFVVTALCIPSYLWWETNESTERVGFACCALAVLGGLMCADSLIRSVRGIFRSWRGWTRWERETASKLEGDSLPFTIVESDAPLVALAGLIRSRVIVSRSVLRSLSAEELAIAIAHERAHGKARDNWKRLALALAPEILPFWRAFGVLNRCWAKLIEWAADDDATQGVSGSSFLLASALVRVARMRAAFAASPLTSFFVGHDHEFSARIDRLLTPAPKQRSFPHLLRIALMTGTAGLGALALMAILHLASFASVHVLFEQFIR